MVSLASLGAYLYISLALHLSVAGSGLDICFPPNIFFVDFAKFFCNYHWTLITRRVEKTCLLRLRAMVNGLLD